MSRRYQSADRNKIRSSAADCQLFCGIDRLGPKLQASLSQLRLCPEEMYADTLELLLDIARQEPRTPQEVERLWYRLYNEYREYEPNVEPNEARRAAGIIFGFASAALVSSRLSRYRHAIPQLMIDCVGQEPFRFDGWADTLGYISEAMLPEGWFDGWRKELSTDPPIAIALRQEVNELYQKLPPSANVNIYQIKEQHNHGCQQFMGKIENPQFVTRKEQ